MPSAEQITSSSNTSFSPGKLKPAHFTNFSQKELETSMAAKMTAKKWRVEPMMSAIS
jgi:hypothetical protein